MIADFKKRFFISLIATIPILVLSPTIQSIFAFTIIIPGSIFVLPSLATFVYAYGGWPFIKGCITELKQKKAGMMTLVAMATTTAHSYSILVALNIFPGKPFFWEVATLIDIMLLGHWIEMKTTLGASKAVEQLAHLLPSTVSVVMPDGSITQKEHLSLTKNDRVLVKPGEKIPADGTIIEGHSDVNTAALTGESKPIFKGKGDHVIGGSTNQNGSLVIQITGVGKESYLQKVIELVKSASASKSHAQTIADKAAFALTITALTTGGITLTIWLLAQSSVHFAVERMVTVMVITCPHALGLAIPLVISNITAIAAQYGLIIKNRKAFERARNSHVVVFDKTGTLTTGKFGVTKIVPLSDWSNNKLLRKAAALEQRSEHTIGSAIVKAAQKENLTIPHVANFKAIPGIGVIGFVEENELFVGTPDIISGHSLFTTNFSVDKASHAQKEIERLMAQGRTVIVVATKTEIKGLLTLSDIVRKESKEACESLKKLKFELAMITGDNLDVANNVAEQLGITHVFAKVMPDKKADKIKELQAQGRSVIMVGDGINDAPALAQADVGVAIGSGTEIAAETADVILVKNDPRDVVHVIKLSRLMYKKMIQNLGWATGYNIFAIPLAAGVLYQYGIVLPPALGALIMSASTIIVAVNSRVEKKSL
ncbi:heavy metal translocating P-type ATPase [Candidatus Dependentiae bacterium]|nr:heavy metal translocating P-type ATPase [Candidatus Dependentiae bacterium]